MKCWILFNSVSLLVASSETPPAGKAGHGHLARGADDNPMGDETPSLLVGGGVLNIHQASANSTLSRRGSVAFYCSPCGLH